LFWEKQLLSRQQELFFPVEAKGETKAQAEEEKEGTAEGGGGRFGDDRQGKLAFVGRGKGRSASIATRRVRGNRWGYKNEKSSDEEEDQ